MITLQERTEAVIARMQLDLIERGKLLLKYLAAPDDYLDYAIALEYDQVLWWVMQAEQVINGERLCTLHDKIAAIKPDLLKYIAKGEY